MQKGIVETYIEEILNNRLQKFNIKEKYIQQIKDNVEEQMNSLILHWGDVEFRKAILIVGMEEAEFYVPEADIDVKCFVVVTIRNSYIEQIFCDSCQIMELDKPINEALVKTITQEAIEYFKNVDFYQLSKDTKNKTVNDKYGNIVKKYPMAWKALIELGKCVGNKRIYEKIEVQNKITIDELKETNNNSEPQIEILQEVESGINDGFSQELLKIIKNIIEYKGRVFYVDCFKMATRNFEKLLKIIEILLENEVCFLTSNYLLTSTYIGKRSQIYRAAHNEKEMAKKLENQEMLYGISKLHRTILKEFIDEVQKTNF